MTFISYAQNGEDVILWRALQHVENGFYIDVGAWDPLDDSVTHAFYERGWSGINIEPSREYYERCVQQRSRDINLNVALGAVPGVVRFMNVNETGLSSTVEASAAAAAARGWAVQSRDVPALTLKDVCASFSPPEIHFLKIDVEGGELAVLQGADFNRFRPWIVVVEATLPNSRERSDSEWEPILLQAGYHRVLFDGLNLYFVAEEHQELAQHLTSGACTLDNFRSINAVRSEERASQLEAQLAERQAALEQMRTQLEQAQDRLREAEQAASQADSERAAMAAAHAAEMAAVANAHTTELTAQQSKLEKAVRALAQSERKSAEQARQLRDATLRLRRQGEVLDEISQIVASGTAQSEVPTSDTVALLRRHLAEQAHRIALLHQQQAEVILHRDNLLSSTSWQVTRPLRKVRTALHVLRRDPGLFMPLLSRNLRLQPRQPALPAPAPDPNSAAAPTALPQMPAGYERLSHRDRLVAAFRGEAERQRRFLSSL
jgi:FkbM family methyltransferase